MIVAEKNDETFQSEHRWSLGVSPDKSHWTGVCSWCCADLDDPMAACKYCDHELADSHRFLLSQSGDFSVSRVGSAVHV
jgi:hypothetical protein